MNRLSVVFMVLIAFILGVFQVGIHVVCETYKKHPITTYLLGLVLVVMLVAFNVTDFMSYGYSQR